MQTTYMDTTLSSEARARLLLAELTYEEKVAQLTGYMPARDDFEAVKVHCTHGIGHISTLEMRRMTSLEEVVVFQRQVQALVMAQSKHHIPAIFNMEGLTGAFIQGATSFPTGIGRGSTWNPVLEQKIG